MTIRLSQTQIDAALPKIEKGLQQYLWLQSRVGGSADFHQDAEFRRRFNHFYRVRRGERWRAAFYELMARAMRERLEFAGVLSLLLESTNRFEASFASKLVATLDPSKPVIDRMVLKNLGLRLPGAEARDRAAGICEVHRQLASLFSAFLGSADGTYLTRRFLSAYPSVEVTDVKMLDLVLWQTGR